MYQAFERRSNWRGNKFPSWYGPRSIPFIPATAHRVRVDFGCRSIATTRGRTVGRWRRWTRSIPWGWIPTTPSWSYDTSCPSNDITRDPTWKTFWQTIITGGPVESQNYHRGRPTHGSSFKTWRWNRLRGKTVSTRYVCTCVYVCIYEWWNQDYIRHRIVNVII
jgi:hypothetical protein